MNVLTTTLAATLFIQLGYFMWKLSAQHQPPIGKAPWAKVMAALLRDWRWVFGLISTTVGWILFIQATSLGDISLVQPLMASGDILLVIMAVVFLHERLRPLEWLGIATTVIGGVLLALKADIKQAPAFDAGLLLGLLAAGILAGATLLMLSRRSRRPEAPIAVAVGLAFGFGATLTTAMTASLASQNAAAISASTLINPWLPAIVLSNVAGLVLLQMAFQRGRASVVIPLQLAVANLLAVLIGILVFDETVSPLRAAGVVIILLGTGLLHIGAQDKT